MNAYRAPPAPISSPQIDSSRFDSFDIVLLRHHHFHKFGELRPHTEREQPQQAELAIELYF